MDKNFFIMNEYLTEEDIELYLEVDNLIDKIENCDIDVSISEVTKALYEFKYSIQRELGRIIFNDLK